MIHSFSYLTHHNCDSKLCLTHQTDLMILTPSRSLSQQPSFYPHQQNIYTWACVNLKLACSKSWDVIYGVVNVLLNSRNRVSGVAVRIRSRHAKSPLRDDSLIAMTLNMDVRFYSRLFYVRITYNRNFRSNHYESSECRRNFLLDGFVSENIHPSYDDFLAGPYVIVIASCSALCFLNIVDILT